MKCRSSHPKYSFKKGVLKNFKKLTGKNLCRRLFLVKLQAWTLLKKRLRRRYFPVNFEKFLRTLFCKTPPGGCFWEWTIISVKNFIDERHKPSWGRKLTEAPEETKVSNKDTRALVMGIVPVSLLLTLNRYSPMG